MLMLRNRSRAVASKQNRMTDHTGLPSPKQDQTTPISSCFMKQLQTSDDLNLRNLKENCQQLPQDSLDIAAAQTK